MVRGVPLILCGDDDMQLAIFCVAARPAAGIDELTVILCAYDDHANRASSLLVRLRA